MKSVKGNPAAIRVVLLERHVVHRAGSEEILAFARAAWGTGDTGRRAEWKAWLAGATVHRGELPAGYDDVKTRSRSLASCRDPMLAQEWAWGLWEEYLRDVGTAGRTARP